MTEDAGDLPTPATALVTAAGRRIGKAIAIDLGRQGFDVAVHFHRSAEEADAVVAEIRRFGVNAVALRADLSMAAEAVELIPRAAEALGAVTCLVNNASVFEADDITTVSPESWDAHLDLNLRAPTLLARAFAGQLPDGVQGNIINMIDERVLRPNPQFMSYFAAKFGLWGLTQTWAQGFGGKIRVNGIGPGPTVKNTRQTDAQFARVQSRLPLGYGPTLADICGAVRFILRTPSLTGQMIALDSGQHLAWQTPDLEDSDG